MRAGALLSLLFCLVAVTQGAEILLNPEFDGCDIDGKPTSWTGSLASFSFSTYSYLFLNSPPGDKCFDYLYSNPGLNTVSQTITIPTTGNYDFSALAACFVNNPLVTCEYTLTINGQNFPLTGATNVPGADPSIYLPVTALGITLPAGTYDLVITSVYVAEDSTSVYFTSASLMPAGGGSGDPHMVGFQGQVFDYIGEAGQVINLVTDPELQLNALLNLQKVGVNSFMPGPVMMEMAFVTRGHTVVINAGGYQKEETAFVTVDGVSLPVGQSFLDGILSVTFTAVNTNSQLLGLTGNDHIVAQADVKLEGLYEFRVFMIENGKDNLHHTKWVTNFPRRFLDFNASLLDLERRPHGVLGQTAAPLVRDRSVGEWTIEGKDEDYVVKDGLTGTQFTFNKF